MAVRFPQFNAADDAQAREPLTADLDAVQVPVEVKRPRCQYAVKGLPSAVLRALSCWEHGPGSDRQRHTRLGGERLSPRRWDPARRPEARRDVADEALERQQTRPA